MTERKKIGGGVTAVVPVKGSSTRLKNKNILPFAGSNLLVHKLRQLKQVDDIEEIIVSSDSEEMLDFARAELVTAIPRPSQYADESRPFREFLRYICGEIKTEHVLWAQCTSPMVSPELYAKALRLYREKLGKGWDSLLSVYRYQHYLFNEHGPMNFNPWENHLNSQDLPALYYMTSGIFVAPRLKISEWGFQFGPNAYRMEVAQEEAIDIDTWWDYVCAKAYWEENTNAGGKQS